MAIIVVGLCINVLLIIADMIISEVGFRSIRRQLFSFISKSNDIAYSASNQLTRIERRCDSIDQRTKAHLVSKKKSNKPKFKPKGLKPDNKNKEGKLFNEKMY